MPSIAASVGIAGQSMCHPSLREMRFDMAATNRITPIDESEVAVNESAGSDRSEPTRAVRRHLPDERREELQFLQRGTTADPAPVGTAHRRAGRVYRERLGGPAVLLGGQ